MDDRKEYSPYDLMFQTMPFNYALNWSIRYAKECLYKQIDAHYSIHKWISDFEATGEIVYDSREITPWDFEEAIKIAKDRKIIA